MIDDGKYSVLYSDGEYRTYRIKTHTRGMMEGKTIISRGTGEKWEGLAFLNDDDRVGFWKRIRMWDDFEQIDQDVAIILNDPAKAAQAFAMYEGRCSRCGRKLTVPASIHHGLGPECAGKGHWTKQDQKNVYSET